MSSTPNNKRTEANIAAGDLRSGMLSRTPDSVYIAQRLTYSGILKTALNSYFAEYGTAPATLDAVSPFMGITPLTIEGEPWPLINDVKASTFPAIELESVSGGHRAFMVSNNWDGQRTDLLDLAHDPEWQATVGAKMRERRPRLPQDLDNVSTAYTILSVPAHYKDLMGSYTGTPAEAFQLFCFGTNPKGLKQLLTAYPTSEFMRVEDGSAIALHLTGGTYDYLIVHYLMPNGRPMIRELGYNDLQKQEKIEWLSKLKSWQSLRALDTPALAME